MKTDNKHNLQYFEADTMAGLFGQLQNWQDKQQKRFLSTNIQFDNGKFCCIALTNPAEVVITDQTGTNHATVSQRGHLTVYESANP